MNKKGNIILILLVVLIIGAVVVVAGGLLPDFTSGEERMDLECMVELRNPPLLNTRFGDVVCSTKPSSLFTLASILPDFLEDKGTIKLKFQNKATSRRYEISEPLSVKLYQSKKYEIKLSKLEKVDGFADLILYNDDGEILETRSIFVTG